MLPRGSLKFIGLFNKKKPVQCYLINEVPEIQKYEQASICLSEVLKLIEVALNEQMFKKKHQNEFHVAIEKILEKYSTL